jgi:F-type H+-transporting ATPase subunit delta
MKISDQQYAQTLFDLVEGASDKQVEKNVLGFAKLLVARHEAWRLVKIISEFKRLWDKELAVVKAEISSFSVINKKTEDLLRTYIKKVTTASELELSARIDKNIFGGVVLKYGDKIFDTSLKLRLDKLKEKIIN